MNKYLFGLLLINGLAVAAMEMQIKISPEQIESLGIKVAALHAGKVIPKFYAPAKVAAPANRELLISSTQPGLVVQLMVNIGDHIEKGQVLAKISSPDLVTLQRQFLTARNDLMLSEADYNRDKKLLQEGVIAERRWLETQTVYSSKTAEFDTFRQLLEMAGMSESEIKTLIKTRKLNNLLNVVSPISGVVLDRSAVLGARLDIQAPIYRIADINELWLEINIPQEQANAVHIGDRVQIEGFDDTAKVSLVGQSVNHDNQTVPVRAVIEGQHRQLRPGQNVNVQILQASGEFDFKVGNSAIVQYQGHNFIFVRNAEGFTVTEVEVLGKLETDSLIRAHISDQEKIAVNGSVALKASWLGLGNEK